MVRSVVCVVMCEPSFAMSEENPSSAVAGFRIWIDADACPKAIKELVMRTAFRRAVGVTFVANSYMRLPESELLTFRMVDQGADKADDHIVEEAGANDVVVTADIPLAARLVARSVLTLNPRGEEYTDANIGERLATRNLMDELRSAGTITGGPKEFGSADVQRFANALDRAVTKRLKNL